VALRRQEWDAAQVFFDESLALAQEMGSNGYTSSSLNDLGLVACGRQDWAEARARLEESLALAQQLGDMDDATGCLEKLAEVMGGEGEPEQGARLLGAAEALTETLDRVRWPVGWDAYERTLAALRAALGEPAFAAARAEGRQLSLEQAIDLAVPGAGGRPARWWRMTRWAQEKSPPQ
jgi:hypothetical protein